MMIDVYVLCCKLWGVVAYIAEFVLNCNHSASVMIVLTLTSLKDRV